MCGPFMVAPLPYRLPKLGIGGSKTCRSPSPIPWCPSPSFAPKSSHGYLPHDVEGRTPPLLFHSYHNLPMSTYIPKKWHPLPSPAACKLPHLHPDIFMREHHGLCLHQVHVYPHPFNHPYNCRKYPLNPDGISS